MDERNWIFWIVVDDENHHVLRWPNLTKQEAEKMYQLTDKRTPDNVRRYGYNEVGSDD